MLPSGLNHTNLVLIPKCKNPSTPADFRPIALCNVLYKIVRKLIARRIRPLMDSLVSKNQSAFIPGRHILDNIITTKELIHSMKHSHSILGSFALKLDMSKAYNRVEWNFLRHMLMGVGIYGPLLILIMNCVSSASFSILVNGYPEGFFFAKRGIRQGCPSLRTCLYYFLKVSLGL